MACATLQTYTGNGGPERGSRPAPKITPGSVEGRQAQAENAELPRTVDEVPRGTGAGTLLSTTAFDPIALSEPTEIGPKIFLLK
jgi:hypothetical protein